MTWRLFGAAWPVSIIFQDLDAGMTVDEVMDRFDVTQVRATLALELTDLAS